MSTGATGITVLDWRNSVGDVAYFFGWPAGAEASCSYLTEPRAAWSDGTLNGYTIHETREVREMAFLVEVGGLVIYHNGDWWGDFPTEYAYLRTLAERIDLAFLGRPLGDANPQQRANEDLFQCFGVGVAFGMHGKAGGAGYTAWVRTIEEATPKAPVPVPLSLGQRWVYRRGRVVPRS